MKRWIKRITSLIICLMLTFAFYSYTVDIKAAQGSIEVKFDGTFNSYSSDYFTVTFNDTNGNSIGRNNGALFVGDKISIVAEEGYYISSIQINGTLEDFKATCDLDTASNRDGIVDYDNSLIEYINGASIAYLTAESDTTLTSLEITYTTVKNNYIIFDIAKGAIWFEAFTYKAYNVLGQYSDVQSFNSSTKFYVVQTQIEAESNNLVRYKEPVDDYYINTTGKMVVDLTLDNVWCSYSNPWNGSLGGLNVRCDGDTWSKKFTVRLKGTNIFSRIYYYTKEGTESSLKFTSYKGDGSTEGNLIVIGKQSTKNNDIHGTLAYNGWDAAIGGSDSNDRVYGLEFAGGTILAVATAKDQCTAIGGGGNGYTQMKITGGKVTAIAYTTGTAIGGGIGHKSQGGQSNITITGGEVYAYNLGQPYKYTMDVYTPYNPEDQSGAVEFVPGTAIGSGSSYWSSGHSSNISITGGKVYAYSNGGSGIGGGNSILSYGGSATLNISEGDIKSYGYVPDEEVNEIKKILNNLQIQVLNKVPDGGTIISSTIAPYNYGSDGAGIGGGSGQVGNGGSATINITGGYLDASSIGGGNSQEANGGTATVKVKDGTIRCETIGGGFSNTYGFSDGTVTVTGGSLNATMSALPTNGITSEMLYLTRISVLDGENNPIRKGEIDSLTIDGLVNYSYKTEHTYTDEEGMIYLWLPKNAVVKAGHVNSSDLLPYEEADEVIEAYEIGILKVTDNKLYNYYVNTVTSEYYKLYNKYDELTGILSKELENTTIVPSGNIFTVYINLQNEYATYQINAYYAVESSSGSKTFEKAIIKNIDSDLYSLSLTITQNTNILFEVIGPTDKPHYFIMDLYNGNINVTEGSTGYIIEQNGYVLTGYNGGIYATSGGIATSNNISVDIKKDSEIDLFLNNIIVGSDDYCVGVHSGKVNLTTGSTNDIIHSNNNSAIFVEENAIIEITTDSDDALQLYSGDEKISPISGKGKVIFNNDGGYFQIKTEGSIPQISVGIYEINGIGSFSAELFVDEFEFELIGYIDKNSILHSVTEAQTGNHDNFAARGIYKVLQGVEVINQEVKDGKFYVTLSTIKTSEHNLGVIELTCGEDTLIEGNTSGYTITNKTDDTCTVVIEGAAFKNGSIMIFAAIVGVIPYDVIAYKGVYDGKAHTISIALNTNMFTAYYSETKLTSTNYKTGSTSLDPDYTYTDVTEVTIYIYICKKEGIADATEYTPVETSSTVEITKGTNEWKTQLACPDVAKGYSPNPTALSKWGNVEYIYYNESNQKLADGFDFTNAPLGTYYVKAIVAGTANYDGLETSYKIRFKIIEVKTFTDDTRTFTKVSGTNLSISINLEGEFTVLYSITYADGLKLNVSNTVNDIYAALPIGTKITFIDFSVDVNSGNIKYYYYIIKEKDITDVNNISIPLTEFIQMGTENQKFVAPATDTAVEYQFAIDFKDNRTENSGEIKLTLADNNDKDYQVVNVKFSANPEETITYEKEQIDNQITYDLKINANDNNANKVLVINLSTTNLDGLDVKLYNNDKLMEVTKIVNGMYFYNLSNENISNKVYKLVVTNLFETEKTINVSFDIRNTITDIYYCLNNQTTDNHKAEAEEILLDKYEAKQIKVETQVGNNNEGLIITEDNTNLYLNIYSNINNLNYNDIKLVLYIKTPNGIFEYQLEAKLTIKTDETGASYITIPYLREGTYLIEFSYKDVSDKISFIVKK